MYMAAYMVPSVSQFWARRMRKAREYSGRGGKDEGAASCMSPGTLPALAPHRQSLPLDSCLLGEEPLEAELRLRVWHLAPPAHRQQFTEWPPHQLRAPPPPPPPPPRPTPPPPPPPPSTRPPPGFTAYPAPPRPSPAARCRSPASPLSSGSSSPATISSTRR